MKSSWFSRNTVIDVEEQEDSTWGVSWGQNYTPVKSASAFLRNSFTRFSSLLNNKKDKQQELLRVLKELNKTINLVSKKDQIVKYGENSNSLDNNNTLFVSPSILYSKDGEIHDSESEEYYEALDALNGQVLIASFMRNIIINNGKAQAVARSNVRYLDMEANDVDWSVKNIFNTLLQIKAGIQIYDEWPGFVSYLEQQQKIFNSSKEKVLNNFENSSELAAEHFIDMFCYNLLSEDKVVYRDIFEQDIANRCYAAEKIIEDGLKKKEIFDSYDPSYEIYTEVIKVLQLPEPPPPPPPCPCDGESDEQSEDSECQSGSESNQQGSEGSESNQDDSEGSEGSESNQQGSEGSEGSESNQDDSEGSEGSESNQQGSEGSEGSESNQQGSEGSEGSESNQQGSEGSEGSESNQEGSEGSESNQQGSESNQQGGNSSSSKIDIDLQRALNNHISPSAYTGDNTFNPNRYAAETARLLEKDLMSNDIDRRDRDVEVSIDPSDKVLDQDKFEQDTEAFDQFSDEEIEHMSLNSIRHYKLIPAVNDKQKDQYKQIVMQNRRSIASLKNCFEFHNTEASVYSHGLSSGSIDENSLFKTCFNEYDRLYERKDVLAKKKWLVSVLLDQSGSMEGRDISDASELTIVFIEALKALKDLDYSVYGFKTDIWSDMCINIVYKDKTVDKSPALSTADADCGTGLGFHINYVGNKNLEQYDDYEHKILFVITDGEPNTTPDDRCGIQHTNDCVKLLKKRGFHVYGIGINNAFSSKRGEALFGKGNFVVIKDVKSTLKILTNKLRMFLRNLK